jgi:hypothetical protein
MARPGFQNPFGGKQPFPDLAGLVYWSILFSLAKFDFATDNAVLAKLLIPVTLSIAMHYNPID